MSTLATQLRTERIRKGYTQATLAKASGVSERTIQTAEAGGSVSTETLRALGAVLGPDFCGVRKSPDEIEFDSALSRLRDPGKRISIGNWVVLTMWVGVSMLCISLFAYDIGWIANQPKQRIFLTFVVILCFLNSARDALQEATDTRSFALDALKPDAWTVLSGLQNGVKASLTTEQRALLKEICGTDAGGSDSRTVPVGA